MIKIDCLENSSGKIIYSSDRRDIFSLPVEKIKELFKLSGLLIFKDFDVSCDHMQAFSKQFSSKFIGDTGRAIVDLNNEFVRLVDPEMYAIDPHCEHAHTPYRVDALMFCCAVPALQGSETLFWDGVRVWEELSEELKQLFISKKLMFFNHYSVEQWRYFLGADASINDVKKALNEFEGVSYQINKDGSISIKYRCSAVVKTRYGDEDAFANSLVNLYSSKGENVKFEDGSPIAKTVIDDIKKVMNRLTEVVEWQAGDLVMVDNSKFLHGRRAFNDNRRQIFIILSDLNF
jgi:Taurine catabolism dioxygenase TauD, TfdA family